jgi:hypothetical protein
MSPVDVGRLLDRISTMNFFLGLLIVLAATNVVLLSVIATKLG